MGVTAGKHMLPEMLASHTYRSKGATLLWRSAVKGVVQQVQTAALGLNNLLTPWHVGWLPMFVDVA